MKRIFIVMALFLVPGVLVGAPRPDHEFFRAMHDEMQRTLRQLRLKNHAAPYYVAYWVEQLHTVRASAQLGTLVPLPSGEKDKIPVNVRALVSVGSDKEDALNFVAPSRFSRGVGVDTNTVPAGYESIRKGLWLLSNDMYLNVTDLYQAKKAYKQKKNIHDTLPDIVPSEPAQFAEEITPFERPDVKRLENTVKTVSALGKTLAFVESFSVDIDVQRKDIYFLNSRGAFAQYMRPSVSLYMRSSWRQPDGEKQTVAFRRSLPDVSDNSLMQIQTYAREFLARIERAYGGTSGETYIGPVLLKPRAAERLLWFSVLQDMQQTKPLLRGDRADSDDPSAGKLNKKRAVRVSTDLLTVYDRPLARDFEGIALARFSPVDDEGVAGKNITLVENGRVKELPLSQRPLTKKHQSNGHGFFDYDDLNMVAQGLRERLTNVFVEPKEQLTDAQMEEKLLARCRELGLEYGYILHDGLRQGGNALSVERIYTADGHKEAVLNMKWDGDFFTQRDLRSVLAVGGKSELIDNFVDMPAVVTPSILLSEAELVPREHKPHRKPFIARPK